MASEQDGEVIDNWEDFDENPHQLEKQIQQISIRSEDKTLKPCDVMVTGEDEHRTPYIPQERKIMILRRPAANEEPQSNEVTTKQRQPFKTLEQRKAEYAEARLRILGDTGKSEEGKPRPIQQKSLEQREADYAAARLRIMGNSKSLEETSTRPLVSKVASGTEDVTITRTPRGPDGTMGFSQKGNR
ncbi:SUZ RNA-binding domain-containing isoform X1 [Oratosquilla oratoria]|uniref:SUZ RNA-binding domain-containing isoform X1 n=1 Tax=Oratosquilla oratoria TaxID=337810 RepID=UPI003F75AF26